MSVLRLLVKFANKWINLSFKTKSNLRGSSMGQRENASHFLGIK